MTTTTYHEFKIKKIRVCEEPPSSDCKSPENVVSLWEKGPATADWFDEDKECIVVFSLNTKLKCTGFFLIALGSLNECTARISEILRPLVVNNSHSFIFSHNHPSGDPTPSIADIELTRRLNEASRIMGIRLQDHVIIGKKNHIPNHSGFFSFRENGHI